MKNLQQNFDYILLSFMKMELNKIIDSRLHILGRSDLKLNDVEEVYVSVQSTLENKPIQFNRFLVR